jgi:hypothetical protein
VKLRCALSSGTAPGVGLEIGLGPFDLREPGLAPGELTGEVVVTTVLAEGLVLASVGRLGLCEQVVDLALKALFDLAHALVAHGLAPRRVGPSLGPIQGDPPEANHAGLLAELQALE